MWSMVSKAADRSRRVRAVTDPLAILRRKVGHGSREHDLPGELVIILVTSPSVTVEKLENMGGGESG